jgi:hypothetical protein
MAARLLASCLLPVATFAAQEIPMVELNGGKDGSERVPELDRYVHEMPEGDHRGSSVSGNLSQSWSSDARNSPNHSRTRIPPVLPYRRLS